MLRPSTRTSAVVSSIFCLKSPHVPFRFKKDCLAVRCPCLSYVAVRVQRQAAARRFQPQGTGFEFGNKCLKLGVLSPENKPLPI
jgi:hypothetical protein